MKWIILAVILIVPLMAQVGRYEYIPLKTSTSFAVLDTKTGIMYSYSVGDSTRIIINIVKGEIILFSQGGEVTSIEEFLPNNPAFSDTVTIEEFLGNNVDSSLPRK